jgi:hypothetical protein
MTSAAVGSRSVRPTIGSTAATWLTVKGIPRP